MNTPDILSLANRAYVGFSLTLLEGDAYPGAEFSADWFKRNMRILANLMRFSKRGDRVVLIYGQAHAAALGPLVDDSGWFCRVNPREFLPAP
ncbi:MAG: hypothetical protein HC937_03795 [Aquincola sp.]|nr:hypothetical protein [Aquincola sp.]